MQNKSVSTIESFTDLIAWQKGHNFVVSIYELTNQFPKHELYSLGDQMRRCAISITSNIAEGFSRKTYKEKIQFYIIALGSLTELQNQLLVARDVKYITKTDFQLFANQTVEISKLVNGLIKGTRKYKPEKLNS